MKDKEELIQEVVSDLKKLILNLIPTIHYDCMSYHILKEAMTILGYDDDNEMNTNGWEVDYWAEFMNEADNDDILEVSGSMYYGICNINKMQ